MDDRIRRLERGIIQGDLAALDALINASIQSGQVSELFRSLLTIRSVLGAAGTPIGVELTSLDPLIRALLQQEDVNNLFRTLQYLRSIIGPALTIEDSFMTRLSQITCLPAYGVNIDSPIAQPPANCNQAIVFELREQLLLGAEQTGTWHGIMPLTREQSRSLNRELRQDRLAWTTYENSRHLYTYFVGQVNHEAIRQGFRYTSGQVTWVDIVQVLEELCFHLVWLNNDEEVEPIPIELARVSGQRGQIFGSYRLDTVRVGMPTTQYDTYHLPGPRSVGDQDTVTLNRYPEVLLHIVPCRPSKLLG